MGHERLGKVIQDLNPFGASVLVCSAATQSTTHWRLQQWKCKVLEKPKVKMPAGQVFLRPLLASDGHLLCVSLRGCPSVCVSVCLSVA